MNNFGDEFTSAWKHALTHVFEINGRASRTEYNCVMIPLLLGIGVLQGLVEFLIIDHHPEAASDLTIFTLLYALLLLICTFCLVGRRNSDVGVSKWFALLMLIPQLNYIYLIILMIMRANARLRLFPHHHLYLGE